MSSDDDDLVWQNNYIDWIEQGVLCQYCSCAVHDLLFSTPPGCKRSCEYCNDDPAWIGCDLHVGKSIRNICCVCGSYIGRNKDGTFRKLRKRNNNRCVSCQRNKEYPERTVARRYGSVKVSRVPPNRYEWP